MAVCVAVRWLLAHRLGSLFFAASRHSDAQLLRHSDWYCLLVIPSVERLCWRVQAGRRAILAGQRHPSLDRRGYVAVASAELDILIPLY